MSDLVDRTVVPINQVVTTKALLDIIAERKRQIDQDGHTIEDHDGYEMSELPRAASCYAMATVTHFAIPSFEKMLWPWSATCWQPRDARENLVRAGALILAEIERLDRASARIILPPTLIE